MNERTVVCDVGGTHVRFARVDAGESISAVTSVRVTEHASFESALGAYLDSEPGSREARAVAVAAAGPLREGRVELTNIGWTLDRERVRRAARTRDALLVNDFTALAHAVPALGRGDLRLLGGGDPVPGTASAVLGPGTGLGVSGLVPGAGGAAIAIEGEGGHRTLGGSGPREAAVVARLAERFGHASAERALSGPGLVNVFRAIVEIDGGDLPDPLPAPAEIAALAWRDGSAPAREAVELFTAWLGSVAGDLALTLGARAGVYIGGGIVPRWGDHFDARRFRAHFEAKGRFSAYLRAIPTYVITTRHPTLIGLARMIASPCGR